MANGKSRRELEEENAGLRDALEDLRDEIVDILTDDDDSGDGDEDSNPRRRTNPRPR